MRLEILKGTVHLQSENDTEARALVDFFYVGPGTASPFRVGAVVKERARKAFYKLPIEVKEKIREMIAEGKRVEEVASALGISIPSVRRYSRPSSAVVRRMRTSPRRYTKEDSERAYNLYFIERKTIGEVSKLMNVPRGTVYNLANKRAAEIKSIPVTHIESDYPKI